MSTDSRGEPQDISAGIDDGDIVDAELVDAVLSSDGSTAPAGEEYPDITADDDSDLIEAVDVAETIAKERDEYLDMARRVQAEFENYKRRVDAQRDEQRERAAESLVRELLPVLDAAQAAVAAGSEEIPPLQSQLLATLEKQGLGIVDEAGIEFDPNIHEAVMHEDGDADPPVVAEVLRTGYLWNSRVLRPAMVKVRG